MALGIETNNVAPQLIANSGQALVQGIRQIGQQISGHLTEMQTKRDLAGFAQEMQGLNPQSADFPVQLIQLSSRHPMAVRDERGQMAMSILGKAHGQWQAEEADARAFQRAMQMQGIKDTAAASRAAAAEEARAGRPTSVHGVGLVNPATREVLIPEKAREGSAAPFRSSPQGIFDARTGLTPDGLPLPALDRSAVTGSQKLLAQNRDRQAKIQLLTTQLKDADSELDAATKRIDGLVNQKLKLGTKTADMENRKYLDDTAIEVQKQAATHQKRKDELLKALEDISARAIADEQGAVEPELGAVPASAAMPVQPASAPAGLVPAQVAPAVLPPMGGVPAAAPTNEMVMVIDPQGRPGRIRASQLEAALQNGYKRR